jgi:uncharacterized protein YbbC (DUF1343 family)/CubicO group peptidase (beta-lactamase class C family)
MGEPRGVLPVKMASLSCSTHFQMKLEYRSRMPTTPLRPHHLQGAHALATIHPGARARYHETAMRACCAGFVALAFILSLAPGTRRDRAAAAIHAAIFSQELNPIAAIVRDEIARGHVPGAVVLIGKGDRILYRHAFGLRATKPHPAPMTTDTIFDLASLTKVVATTTAIMQLAQRGMLELDAPVARYWPSFAAAGKSDMTIRELLTHYSGLKGDLNLSRRWSGYDTAMEMLVADRPVFAPGTHYLYSDENFEALGEVAQGVSGLPLDLYCRRNIFDPLGMENTGFKEWGKDGGRIAQTQWLDGKPSDAVNDPTAGRMGGIAGHAGLFSSTDDLAIFARMLLHRGRLRGAAILSPASVAQMTLPESPAGGTRLRGFGWDIGAPLTSNRHALFPAGSYGHTGYTGTMLWIDPVTDTYVIILTNRTYPDGRGDAGPLRKRIIELVSAWNGPLTPSQVVAQRPALARYYPALSIAKRDDRRVTVMTGIDVLRAQDFAPLRGLRIGLITNQTGRDAAGESDIDLLRSAPDARLVAVFSPEHGLNGTLDEKIGSGIEPVTGLPLFSLYGDVMRPTPAMLHGIDALVFDLQGVGTRFYTYVTTMAYAMEAAAGQGIDFYVLDRPDPIDAAVVQGPVLDRSLESFTGYFPLPVRYGMTMGELAQMFNTENHIGAKLHVITMRGYRRGDWYDNTGLRWVAPSPNLRSLTEAALYPGVALVEGANVSVGRGTATPFEILGAPWIDGGRLSVYLTARKIAGIRFYPVDFTPPADSYKNQECHGVRIDLIDRKKLDAPALGIELASALYRLYPAKFRIGRTLGLIGSRRTLTAIDNQHDPRVIVSNWQPSLAKFRRLRAQYLLY